MLNPEWLPVILQASFSEIYVLDCADLRFLASNEAAQKNVQYSAADLAGMTPIDIAEDLTAEIFVQILQPLQQGLVAQAAFTTIHKRRDGSIYPIEFRLFHVPSASQPVIVAIGNDISARYESANALRLSESRFHAIVSNTPGLVFQCRLSKDGQIGFPYLSEGCQALLGLEPEQLQTRPELFLDLILPEDRASFRASMSASAAEIKSWNWEGRIWIEQWKDVKWINLRCTPRAMIGDEIQWEGIMSNITESKLEETEMKRSRQQLAELSAHIDKVKEQERTRIAREIHDDLGGNLTAIKMALALLARRLPPAEDALIEKARYADSLVDRTIEAIHRIAGDLRPGILDFGIVEAIRWQAKEFEKQAGISCSVTSNRKEITLSPDQATALFRIFQEALTNIGKHAQASKVEVNLIGSNRNVRLEIADNGKGLVNTDRLKPDSFGIRGMVERASALGGELDVKSGPAGGCVVMIRIPLTPA
ncbi:MAG: PAS domain S-box protein [Proteobacteria bacterium]|nr:PAS domain S-box protein [Pseudomonadota bacterium]